MSNLIKIDNDYAGWIKDLSLRFRQSQIKAAVKVNSEMLKFYFSLGADKVFRYKAFTMLKDSICFIPNLIQTSPNLREKYKERIYRHNCHKLWQKYQNSPTFYGGLNKTTY